MKKGILHKRRSLSRKAVAMHDCSGQADHCPIPHSAILSSQLEHDPSTMILPISLILRKWSVPAAGGSCPPASGKVVAEVNKPSDCSQSQPAASTSGIYVSFHADHISMNAPLSRCILARTLICIFLLYLHLSLANLPLHGFVGLSKIDLYN